mgnify:FL=1
MQAGDIIGSEGVRESSPSVWKIRDDRSGITQEFESEPTSDDIKCFNRSRGYSSSKIVTKDDDSKLIVIRPVDKSGTV